MEIDKTNIILNNDGSIYHLGLFPNEINDIIFTVGDPDRVKFVSRHFNSINLNADLDRYPCSLAFLK